MDHALALQNSTVSVSVSDGLSFGTLTAATLGGLEGNNNLDLTNESDGTVALTIGANSADTTYFGNLESSGSIIKTGDGTLTLAGTNTFSGGTTINSGTRRARPASLTGNILNQASLVFHEGGGTYAGTIDGTGTLEITGGDPTLSGANTHTSDTTLTAGTLTLGNTLALQNSTLTHASSGNLSFGALTAATLGGLSGDQDLAVALTIGNNDADTTYSGIVSGAGSRIKTGSGNLSLSGTNTYVGGTLTMGSALALESGNTSVGTGAVLDSAAFGFDLTKIAGAGTLNGIFGLAQNGNDLNVTYTISAVPEPASFALFFGLFAVGFATTRRRSR